MPPPPPRIAAAFAAQSAACARMGSPFTAALLAGAGDWLDPATRTGARIRDWPGDPSADALPLRLAGALHALARSGEAPALTAAWPPDPRGDAARAAAEALQAHDARLCAWLDGPPQTNETARAAALLGGALRALALTGAAEIDLLEIGASAGLNLGFDGYAYDLGEGGARGDPDAPVRIPSQWRGPAPDPSGPLRVAARAGCDPAPLDPADPAHRARLTAYVWADQTARLNRLHAALDDAAARPWRVERACAADWLPARLGAPQPPGRLRLVWHSIVWQYLSPAEKAAVAAALDRAGVRAAPDRPLGWLRMERDGTPGSAALTLTLWPSGEARELARTDFHGAWTDWAA